MTPQANPTERAAALSCWSTSVAPEPLSGGITNANFRVEHEGRRFFVRIGDDIPAHGVMRFNEVAASRAAYWAGISPEVIHHEPGALVLDFIEGRTLTPEDIRQPEMLAGIVPLVQRCHRELPQHLRGATLAFWPFQIVRDYAHALHQTGHRKLAQLPELMQRAAQLELAVGPIEMVFGHNDLLAGNFIHDGVRPWLIDWDYAGWGSPLFDLGGLASNNGLSRRQECALLEQYWDRPPSAAELRGFDAMKCVSLLREALWSMVSEHNSTIDFDYPAYTDDNLGRFEAAFGRFETA